MELIHKHKIKKILNTTSLTILSLCITVLLSCKLQNNDMSISQPKLKDTIALETNHQVKHASNDTAAIMNNIKGFLHWYKHHYTTVNNFLLTTSDSKGYYMVDEKACENYLDYLKSSGYISESYTSDWRKYFTSKVQFFKEQPQNEGPPEGFDMDLILLTQEPELILDAIDKLNLKATTIKDDTAVIEVSNAYSMYDFEMSKIAGKWMIDYIATQNYD
jgi:hypothetical protein